MQPAEHAAALHDVWRSASPPPGSAHPQRSLRRPRVPHRGMQKNGFRCARCHPSNNHPAQPDTEDMTISIRSLGVLQQGEFELGDLTLICGDNNTGKTYATYALYGFLSRWRSLLSVAIPEPTIDALLKHGLTRIDVGSYAERAKEIIRIGCEEYQRDLSSIFASKRDHFERTQFLIFLDDHAVISAAKRSFERKRSGFENDTIFSFIKSRGDSCLTISLLTSERECVACRDHPGRDRRHRHRPALREPFPTALYRKRRAHRGYDVSRWVGCLLV